MRNALATLAGLTLLGTAGAANAAISISSVLGSSSYPGTFTYDFETPAPVSGGAIRNASISGLAAQPLGSTGKYWTVSPSDGSPGIMTLASYSAIATIGFLWGSVDNYNWVDVLARNGSVLATFNGVNVVSGPNGSWTDAHMNPYATIAITGSDRTNIGGLRFRSSTNAFETDNFLIGAVPEPATWAMLVLGFGVLGGAMRTRTRRAMISRKALRMA
jgi:hypothetical protein